MAERPVRIMRFSKDGRATELAVSHSPLGPAISCFVDGVVVWSRTCRSPAELKLEVERLHGEFIERGWSEVTLLNS
jgi:hypothetical protein